MPTVDDLVISLRIDDTSNLGKLQKQLTALVGPKGDKPIGLGAGMDFNLKRDISVIKGKLEYITHVSPGLDPKKLRLTAGALYTRLKDPIISKNVLSKLGQNEVWLRDIMQTLAAVDTGMSEMKPEKIANFVSQAEFVINKSAAEIGDVRVAVTKLNEAVEEFVRQKQIVEIMKEFDDSVREFRLGMTKPIEDIKVLIKDKGFQDFLKEEKAKVGGEEKISELVERIKELKDPFVIMGKLAPGIEFRNVTKLVDKLRPLVAAYLEVMKEQQILIPGVIRDFLQGIKKTGKGLTTKRKSASVDFLTKVGAFQEMLEKFEGKGLEVLMGKEYLEKAKPGEWAPGEYEKGLAGKYVAELLARQRQFQHTYALVGESNTLIDKYLPEFEQITKETGHTITIIKIITREILEAMGKAPTLEEMNKAVNEEFKKNWDQEQLKTDITNPNEELEKKFGEVVEKEKESMVAIFKGLEDTKELGKDVEGKISDVNIKAEKLLEEQMKALMGIKETTDNTNEEVNKKKINGDKVEESPGKF